MGYSGPAGRLELTWTNKHLRLIDQLDGSYEWVDPADWRVSEVRLLQDREAIGETGPDDQRAADNLVIQGDALAALRALTDLPEFAEQYAGKVRLVYIDPPFNTGQTFEHYEDALEHSVWLTMFRDRLLQIKRLLAPNGSVWVHLDDAEVHRARCVMDEVFGPGNFIATIVWEKADSPRNSARHFSTDQDYLLVYANSAEAWRPNRLPRDASINAKYTNPDNDPRGRWFGDNLRANKPYKDAQYEVVGPTGRTHRVPPGRYWRVSRERFDELDADDRIWWGSDGNAFPTLKRFLADVGDVVPRTIWGNREVGSNRSSKNVIKKLFPGREPFATPKPERLMERIIHIGSDPGDIVLDCFGGSGTTAAVALKMGRRFVTVEREAATVDTFLVPRLTKVVKGDDPGGVTEVHDWTGGGGFRVLDVAPSMFDADEDGTVYLADWATDRHLAETTAAQLGIEYDPEGPFSGSRGRVRLAVIDGLINRPILEALSAHLGDDETLLAAGTAVAPDAEAVARELVRGARVRKIPSAILTRFRREAAAR